MLLTKGWFFGIITAETSNYLESVYKVLFFVIHAVAGTHNLLKFLDSRFHGNDNSVVYKRTLFSHKRHRGHKTFNSK